MSLPPTTSLLTPARAVDSPAPVEPVAGGGAEVTPLDLVIFTCDFDWNENTDTLCDAAGRAGIDAEVVSFEGLTGHTPGERLACLHKITGEWLASGKLTPSTVVYVDLHGGPADEFDGLPDYFEARPDLKAFHQSLGDASAQCEAASDHPSLFVFSAVDQEFPGFMLDRALRHASPSNGSLQSDFRGLIVWGACHARDLSPNLMNSGGENLLLAGKKPVLSTDSEDCMLEVIDLLGARKREAQPPLSGRDYWMHLRNVSGEHIAFVQESSVEISKVLEAGHSEPVLHLRTGRASGQARRVLDAKLAHGSAKALQAVFDQYGTDAFSGLGDEDLFPVLALDAQSTDEEFQKKLDVLARHGFGLRNDVRSMQAFLSACIETQNARMLSTGLRARTHPAPGRLLLDAIDALIESTDTELTSHLYELLAENTEIAQQWFSLIQQARPPEIRRAIERRLTNASGEDTRAEQQIRFCVSGSAACLLNLLYDAFERDRDLSAAESLLPHAAEFPKPSRLASYLNTLLQHSLTQFEQADLRGLLGRHGITEVDEADYASTAQYFSYKLPWLK